MKKYISTGATLLAGLIILMFGSCASTDDNQAAVTDEWKNHQAKMITDAVAALDSITGEKLYSSLVSESGLGRVYHRSSDYITENQKGDFNLDGPSAFKSVESDRPIYETDKVKIRYEGWFYNLDGRKIVFDSTERDINTGASLNNTQTYELEVNGFVDGFSTVLLDMKVGEERIVCIPYLLGYGVYGQGNIPGYTTLFFDIKLLNNLTAEAESK